LKHTYEQAFTFQHWMELMKTKRYTQTRLQRMFVHLLTNTTKNEIEMFLRQPTVPYIRLLGLSKTGRSYLNRQKKQLDIPIYTNLNNRNKQALQLDEKATSVYYHVLGPERRNDLRKQEFALPIML